MTFHKPSHGRPPQEAGTELRGILFRELPTPDSTLPCCRVLPLVQAAAVEVAAEDYPARRTKQR